MKKEVSLATWAAENTAVGLCPGCVFAHLRTLRGGMAVTLPTGLGPTTGGIMTSRPGEDLEAWLRAGLTVGEVPLAGLRGSGLWGGKGDGLGCSSDTNWKRANRKFDDWNIDCSDSNKTGPYGPSLVEKCIDLRIIMCFSELKLYSSQMTVNWKWALKSQFNDKILNTHNTGTWKRQAQVHSRLD